MHFTQVRPNLWIGSWEPAADEALLKATGITTVVNVCRDRPDPILSGIAQIHFMIIDGNGNPRWLVENAIQTMDELLRRPEQKVLIHCVAGRSRSPHIAAKALAFIENRPYAEIYAEFAKLIRDSDGNTVWQPSLLEGKY